MYLVLKLVRYFNHPNLEWGKRLVTWRSRRLGDLGNMASWTLLCKWWFEWENPVLVGGLEPWNFMTFHILGMSSSQLTFIFFRGVGIPPTNL